MAVKASGRFVPPSAFAAGTGKAFTGAYAWNAPREAVGRERPLTRDEMRQVQGVLSTINRLPYFLRSLFTSRYDYIRRNKSPVMSLTSASRLHAPPQTVVILRCISARRVGQMSRAIVRLSESPVARRMTLTSTRKRSRGWSAFTRRISARVIFISPERRTGALCRKFRSLSL